jgi:hypothetical protein
MEGQTEYLPQVMEIENIYKIMVGKHSGKHPLGAMRRRWQCSVMLYLTVIGYCNVKWIEVAQYYVQWYTLMLVALKLLGLLPEN